MIQKLVVVVILTFLIIGTAMPVLATGGGDGGNGSGGPSDSGSSADNSGTSSGKNGGPSGGGPSTSNSGSLPGSGSESSGSESGVQIRAGPVTTGGPSEVPTQEQSRDQSHVTNEPSEVPTQEQSRLHSQNQTELNRQYLQEVHDRQAQLLQDRQLSQDQINRDLALYSITTAGNVSGKKATQFIQLAEQVKQSYSVTDQARTRIQEQSLITRFFLGGNATAAQILIQTTEQNLDRIQLMEQDLQNCDCNQTIRDQLQEQLITLTQDQDQLRTLANQTLQDRGIFGGFFR